MTIPQAKKVVSYAESDDNDDEEDVFDPAASISKKRRASQKPKVEESDEDVFVGGMDGAIDEDDGIFISAITQLHQN